MSYIKFRLYDKKLNKVIGSSNYSLAIDGTVQSINKDGVIEGTLMNRHLIPLLFAGKVDISGHDIYEGYIVKRESDIPGEDDITGVVTFDECSWWIENKKEKKAVKLFSETAIDRIIGNMFSDNVMAAELGFS